MPVGLRALQLARPVATRGRRGRPGVEFPLARLAWIVKHGTGASEEVVWNKDCARLVLEALLDAR